MDCLGNNNRLEWYRTKDVEPPEGTWLWTLPPDNATINRKTRSAMADMYNRDTKRWCYGGDKNLYWTYPITPESI